MKKFLLWLSIVLLCTSCVVSAVRHPQQRQTLAERLDDETVALVLVDEGQIHPFCTGVWVSKTLILTAEHCVEEDNVDEDAAFDPIGRPMLFAIKSEVADAADPKKMHFGTVIAVDKIDDLALVSSMEVLDHPIAEVSTDIVHDGDEMNVVGHTVGYWWSYMKGYMSCTKRYMEDPRGYKHTVMQISIPIYKGNSGGGAFDENGKLVGIASFIGAWPGLTFFVHHDEIVAFLSKNQVISRRL
jgi:S1-C subfamily serine protease